MKKEVRRFSVEFDFDWADGVEISKIREDLDSLEKLGATHVEIESQTNFDYSFSTFDSYVDREETDEECLSRVKDSEVREYVIKQRELEQLKKLQAKYNL
tara:strand:- start:184 stop:483 length:300 start_codon:yes stop_codon:yes gene_type:complete